MSVIIPTGGRVGLLRRAVASALAQRDVALELIVVADAAVEETEAAVAGIGDPRARVLRTAGGVGPAAGRNLGVADAKGEWVAFLDDDDLWAPVKLSAQLAAARSAGADWCYTEAVDIDEHCRVVGEERPPAPDELRRQLRRTNAVPAGASNVLVRTAVIRAVGGFDDELTSVTDWDLALRLDALGPPAMAPGLLVAYRRHAANMHADDPAGFMAEVDRLEVKHRAHGVAPDRVTLTRWLAGAQRRAGRPRGAARLYLRGALSHRNPGNALRAVAVLGGESLMSAGRALRGRRGPPSDGLEWLSSYT